VIYGILLAKISLCHNFRKLPYPTNIVYKACVSVRLYLDRFDHSKS